MKYLDAEKLKAEIERLKYNAELGQNEAQGISSLTYNIHLAEELICSKLLNFIDTIPEQPVETSQEFRQEVINFCQQHFAELHSDMDTIDIVHIIARHFAEWGAEHLRDTTKMIPEGLEEAAFTYENDLWESGFKDCGYSPQEVNDAFKAGAEWGAEHLKK